MIRLTPTRSHADRTNDRDCKGCSASVHVSKEVIEHLVEQVIQGEDALTSEGDYAGRINACGHCESLQFGTTCRWCGCLVAVKAKKAEATCSHPDGSRWSYPVAKQST